MPETSTVQQATQKTKNSTKKTAFSIGGLQNSGFASLAGAELAVLSSFGENETISAEQSENFFDDTGETSSLAEDENLGFFGKIDRFFSRSVDFKINGSPITGKSGHQVKGSSVLLDKGLVLDLGPAQLTGRRSGSLHSAVGSGADLFFANRGGTTVTKQQMGDIEINSNQKISAEGLGETPFHLDGLDMSLGKAKITQNENGTKDLRFDNIKINKLGNKTVDTSFTSPLIADSGEFYINKITFKINNKTINLEYISSKDGVISFENGDVSGKDISSVSTFEGGVLSEADISQKIANATPPNTNQNTSTVQTPETPSVYENATPVIIDTTTDDENTIYGGAFTLTDTTRTTIDNTSERVGTFDLLANLIIPDNGFFTPNITAGSVATNGDINLGEVKGSAEGVSYTKNDDGTIMANLINIEGLEAESDAYGGFIVNLKGISITNNVVSINEIAIEAVSKNEGFSSEVDGDAKNGSNDELIDNLTNLLTFSIPPSPKRAVYTQGQVAGGNITGTFSRSQRDKYEIGDVGGGHGFSIDFENNQVKGSYSSTFFEFKEKFTLMKLPLLPGLNFEISLNPSAKTEGKLGVSGKMDSGFFEENSEKSLELNGNGELTLEGALSLDAAVSAGLPMIAELALALFASAKMGVNANIGTSITLKKESGKIKPQDLTFNGNFDCGLNGSVGVKSEAKVLFWQATLFECTFKEWELAKFQLSANASKTFNNGVSENPTNSGWDFSKSSFTAAAFKNEFENENNESNKMGINPVEKVLLDALKLSTDFKDLRTNFKTLAEYYNTANQQIGTAGAVVNNPEKQKETQDKCLEFYENVKNHALTAKLQLAEIDIQNENLKLEIEKKNSGKNSEHISKHRHRIMELDLMKAKMDDQPTIGNKFLTVKESVKDQVKDNLLNEALRGTGAGNSYYEKIKRHYSRKNGADEKLRIIDSVKQRADGERDKILNLAKTESDPIKKAQFTERAQAYNSNIVYSRALMGKSGLIEPITPEEIKILNSTSSFLGTSTYKDLTDEALKTTENMYSALDGVQYFNEKKTKKEDSDAIGTIEDMHRYESGRLEHYGKSKIEDMLFKSIYHAGKLTTMISDCDEIINIYNAAGFTKEKELKPNALTGLFSKLVPLLNKQSETNDLYDTMNLIGEYRTQSDAQYKAIFGKDPPGRS